MNNDECKFMFLIIDYVKFAHQKLLTNRTLLDII